MPCHLSLLHFIWYKDFQFTISKYAKKKRTKFARGKICLTFRAEPLMMTYPIFIKKRFAYCSAHISK